MTPSLVRRWIARHPLSWVLALALVLAGAQTAGLLHELSHGPGSGAGAASAAASRSLPTRTASPLHFGASGDCLTCLAVAALGGAAPAPVLAPFLGAPPSASWTAQVTDGFTPRLLRAYASRAPPSSLAA